MFSVTRLSSLSPAALTVCHSQLLPSSRRFAYPILMWGGWFCPVWWARVPGVGRGRWVFVITNSWRSDRRWLGPCTLYPVCWVDWLRICTWRRSWFVRVRISLSLMRGAGCLRWNRCIIVGSGFVVGKSCILNVPTTAREPNRYPLNRLCCGDIVLMGEYTLFLNTK